MISLFKGPDGKISMMRVSTIIIVTSVVAVFISHNIISMIKGGAFISLGATEAMLLAGVLGMKSIQSFSENKKVTTNEKEDVVRTTE